MEQNPYAVDVAKRMQRPAPTAEWLLEHNRHQSEEFQSPVNQRIRSDYRRKHPTLIGALKCMDGRLNLAVTTKTPMGIIQPFRNIGAKFDIGWPYLQSVISEWIEFAHVHRHDCILFATYHFAKGDKHRGCRGFGYNTEAAIESATELRDRISRVTADCVVKVGVILLGVETDEDALIFHGSTGRTLRLADELKTPRGVLKRRTAELYPCMDQSMLDDLIPLILGNIEHIKEVRAANRSLTEMDHCECCIGIGGRGFDWLHTANKAIIVGAYGLSVREPILNASRIVLDNIRSGRVKTSDGVVLMSSALYWDGDHLRIEKRMAIERAMTLAEFSLRTILADEQLHSELLPHLSVIVGEVDMNTRLFKDRTAKFWEHRKIA